MKKISITLLLFFIFNGYADEVLRPSINNEPVRLSVATKQAVEKKELILYKEDLTDQQKQMLIEALDNKLKNSHEKFSIIGAKFDFPPIIVKSNKLRGKVVYCALVNLKINDRYYHYEPFSVLMDSQKDYIISYLDARALGTTYYGKTRIILSEIIFAENPIAIIYAYSLEGYSIPKWKKHYKDKREDIYMSCEQQGYDLRERAKKLSANKLIQNIYSIYE